MLGWMDDEALARTLTTGARRTGAAAVRSTGSRARPPATASGSRRSASTATATPCWSRSTRRARPATPATAPASTPTCLLARRWLTRRAARFGPVVLLGARLGGAAALAGNRAWVGRRRRRTPTAGRGLRLDDRPSPSTPARCRSSRALALVVLACWGVVLVTRGRRPPGRGRARRCSRRSACSWRPSSAASTDPGRACATTFAEIGDAPTDDRPHGVVLDRRSSRRCSPLVATVLAVALVPGWPEMGSRYDAPGMRPPRPPAAEEPTQPRPVAGHGRGSRPDPAG